MHFKANTLFPFWGFLKKEKEDFLMSLDFFIKKKQFSYTWTHYEDVIVSFCLKCFVYFTNMKKYFPS